jgi:hypothetical protein
MAGIDWDLRLKADGSELAALNRLLKETGVNMEDVKKKASEKREYEALVRDLKKAGVAIEGVTTEEKKLAEAEHHEAGAAKEAKKEHEGFFGDMLKAELAADLIKELGEKFADLTEELVKGAAEAIDFDYKTTTALTAITGSAEIAGDAMERARAFANGVGVDFDEAAQSFQKLAQVGLVGDQLTAAADAAKDLANATGTGFAQTSEFFQLVGSDRGLSGHVVERLKEYPQVLTELEKHFGFVPGAAHSFERLKKHLNEAPVKGIAGVALLEDAIKNAVHEDQLGDLSVKMGDSFEGAANKIKNDWKEALGSIAEDPTIGMIREDLSAIADYFDPANAGGKELAETLKGLAAPAEELFGFLKENRGVIADGLSMGIEAAKFLLEGVVKTVEVLTMALGGLKISLEYLAALSVTRSFSKAADQVRESREEQQLQQSRADEIDRERRLTPAQRKQEEELQRSTAEAIEHPRALPELAPLPAAASGGTVDSTGLVTVHEGEEIVPAGISQSSSNTSISNGGNEFHFHVSVPGGGAEHLDEQLLAAKLAELAPSAIMSALEQMNQMRGGR